MSQSDSTPTVSPTIHPTQAGRRALHLSFVDWIWIILQLLQIPIMYLIIEAILYCAERIRQRVQGYEAIGIDSDDTEMTPIDDNNDKDNLEEVMQSGFIEDSEDSEDSVGLEHDEHINPEMDRFIKETEEEISRIQAIEQNLDESMDTTPGLDDEDDETEEEKIDNDEQKESVDFDTQNDDEDAYTTEEDVDGVLVLVPIKDDHFG